MAKCISPLKLKSGDIVPCGQCYDCRTSRASSWSFRLAQEAKYSDTAYFITLTYNTDNVPLTENGFMSLDKKDYMLFMKRLRKKQKGLKYYTVGEYGSDSFRPHYHAIMFNLDLKNLLPIEYYHAFKMGVIQLDGQTELPCDIWGKGHITIGTLTEASVGYTLKYISKPSKVGKYKRDDRQKEFSLMSKGLGAQYLTKDVKKWHKADILNRMYCKLDGGIKCTMPRYYKQKIYTKHERQGIANHILTNDINRYNAQSQWQKDREDRRNMFNSQLKANKLSKEARKGKI